MQKKKNQSENTTTEREKGLKNTVSGPKMRNKVDQGMHSGETTMWEKSDGRRCIDASSCMMRGFRRQDFATHCNDCLRFLCQSVGQREAYPIVELPARKLAGKEKWVTEKGSPKKILAKKMMISDWLWYLVTLGRIILKGFYWIKILCKLIYIHLCESSK